MSRIVLSCVLAIVGALGCSGADPQGPKVASEAKPPPPPERTVAENHELGVLLAGVGAERACEKIAGEFAGLSASASDKSDKAQKGQETTSGRLWVERCSATQKGDNELEIELVGRGWRFIDRTEKKLGATFGVHQYARFSTEIRATGRIDVAYHQKEKVFELVLTPTKPVGAKLQPLGEIDADSKGPWSTLLGGAASLVGQGPDEKATEKLAKKGSSEMSQKLARGYTVAIDLCTGQRYETMGSFPENQLPQVPIPPRGRLWKANERVELMSKGIDLAGPFRKKDMPLAFEVEVTDGDGVVAQAVCAIEARKVAEAFLSGKPPPEIEALAGEVVRPGKPATLRVPSDGCDVVLYTRPSGKSAKFAYMAYPEQDRVKPVVPCDQP